MEEPYMKNRLARIVVLLSVGGFVSAFAPFWGCEPVAGTQPYVNFIDTVGQDVVEMGVGAAFDNLNNETLTDLIENPFTKLCQDLWSAWVRLQFPADPTFNTLLVH